MNNFIFKEFTLDFLDESVALYMKTYSREPWNESWESKDLVINFFKNHFLNNYFIGYVILLDNKVAGVSLGFSKPWIKGMEYYIDEFFIDGDTQRQGIGSILMNLIKKDIKQKGLNAIFLNTERGYPSQAFYEKLGFKVEESLIILDIGV